MSKKIILTGGGSAGHVTPNLALVPALKNADYDIKYIGTETGIEHSIIEENGIEFYSISAGKLRRYFSMENFTDAFKILKGYFQSKKILKKECPNVVFSKGGFVTVPVVFAAHKLKIPVVLHESDYTPGLANKLCIPRADKICVSFEAAAKHIPQGKCVITGSPVRAELFSGRREKGLEIAGFSGTKPVLLIMGGSLGAQAVNDAVDLALEELLSIFDIIHIRGKGKLNELLDNKAGYKQFEFISEELPDIFAAADLMLSRAGANAIFEFLALELPSLLVPLPKEASRGDQILNAGFFEKKGFSIVLQQSDITPEALVSKLKELLARKDEFKRNIKNSGIASGTENVIKVIFEVGEKNV